MGLLGMQPTLFNFLPLPNSYYFFVEICYFCTLIFAINKNIDNCLALGELITKLNKTGEDIVVIHFTSFSVFYTEATVNNSAQLGTTFKKITVLRIFKIV